MTNVLLTAEQLQLRYGERTILTNFSLQLPRGEVVTLLGASGIGKSSLLKVLAGLAKPAQGSILFQNQKLQRHHYSISLLFQKPNLLPWLNLEQNVGFGLDFKAAEPLSPQTRQRRIQQAINEVGLSPAQTLYPSQLSGGMAQRVALARALARQPALLLLDEPFSALDEITRAEMQALLLRVIRTHQTSAILVTHDIDEALLVSDRIVLLGSMPGQIIGEWCIDLPQPRQDAVRQLGEWRMRILETLKQARFPLAA
jgi:NitT/TauT family transport system ATP-binding protein